MNIIRSVGVDILVALLSVHRCDLAPGLPDEAEDHWLEAWLEDWTETADQSAASGLAGPVRPERGTQPSGSGH